MRYEVRILDRGLSSEEHSYEVPEIAHAFLRLRGKQTRCRCERLRSQNGHRIGTAELRKGADKVKAADVFVAVVPNVVEGYEPVRPGAEYRMIQTQGLDNRVDVVGPKSRISVGVAWLVGEPMAAQVDGDKQKVGR
jgi:hypothetical protein